MYSSVGALTEVVYSIDPSSDLEIGNFYALPRDFGQITLTSRQPNFIYRVVFCVNTAAPSVVGVWIT